METVPMRQPKANLCLQFSDTVDWRNSEKRKDHLDSFESFVAWSVSKDSIKRQDAAKLSLAAAERHAESSTFRRALELRESIYRIFSAAAHGRRPPETDLGVLNRVLSEASATNHVAKKGEGIERVWDVDPAPQNLLLWPIA